MDVKIALIGGGYVGQGFLSVLRKKRELIRSRYGISFELVSICDRLSGSILSPTGLRIHEVLPLLEDGQGLLEYSPADQTCIKGLDVMAGIELSQADVIVECTYSDLTTGEPATTYIRKALSSHKHVVTCNKGPVALHFNALRELARSSGVQFRFEGAVMSGTPVISMLSTNFRVDTVLEVRGILNVTTNYILQSMERGKHLDDVLKEAREKGMAEMNPDLDIDGYDSMAKLLILMNVMTGGEMPPGNIRREGIRNVTPRDIEAALEKDLRYRMVAHAWRDEDGSWKGHVGPFKLSLKDPLYGVKSTRNALHIRTEDRGEVYLEGPGTGKLETGATMLCDLTSIFIP